MIIACNKIDHNSALLKRDFKLQSNPELIVRGQEVDANFEAFLIFDAFEKIEMIDYLLQTDIPVIGTYRYSKPLQAVILRLF